MVSALPEADVGPFEVLNMRRMLELCRKLEVTQTTAIAVMKVYFRLAKCDHGLMLSIFNIRHSDDSSSFVNAARSVTEARPK